MSESSAKSSQPLASKGEKDVSEKRGRGRPRKKPQVRGDPWEEGGWGGTPRGSSAHSNALRGWAPPGYGAARNPPTHTPAASPGQGWGCPWCSPPVIFPWAALLGCLPAGKTLLGGSQPPAQPCNTPELLLTQGRAQGLPLLLPGLQLNLPLQTG